MTPESFLTWARANSGLFTALCFSAAGVLPVLTGGAVLLVDRWLARRAR